MLSFALQTGCLNLFRYITEYKVVQRNALALMYKFSPGRITPEGGFCPDTVTVP